MKNLRALCGFTLLSLASVPAVALTPPPEPSDHVEIVYFDADSTSMSPQAAAQLARAAGAYAQARGRIIVTGHADASASREDAMALSFRMANAVRDHLVSIGVDPKAIATRAFGSQRPAVAATGREPMNRRVEVRACFHCNEGETTPASAGVTQKLEPEPAPSLDGAAATERANRLRAAGARVAQLSASPAECVAAALTVGPDLGWVTEPQDPKSAVIDLTRGDQVGRIDCNMTGIVMVSTSAAPGQSSRQRDNINDRIIEALRFVLHPAALRDPQNAALLFSEHFEGREVGEGRIASRVATTDTCRSHYKLTQGNPALAVKNQDYEWIIEWRQSARVPTIDLQAREVHWPQAPNPVHLIKHDPSRILLDGFYQIVRTLVLHCAPHLGGSPPGAAPEGPHRQVAATSSSAASAQSPAPAHLEIRTEAVAATVNGTAITRADVDRRRALNSLMAVLGQSRENLPRRRSEVLSSLIDERLKIQEAEARNISVTDTEIESVFNRFAPAYFDQTPQQVATSLRLAGSSVESLKQLIRSENAWHRLMSTWSNPADTLTEAQLQIRSARYLKDLKNDSIIEVQQMEVRLTDERQAIGSEIKTILEERRFHDAVGLGRHSVRQLGPCTLELGNVYESRIPNGSDPKPLQAWDFRKAVAFTLLGASTLWLRYEGQGPEQGVQLSPSGSEKSNIGRLAVLLDQLRTSCSERLTSPDM